MSRADLIATANKYFTGMQQNDGKGDYPFAPDCNRIENGMQTTNRPTPAGETRPNPATATNYSAQWSCREQFESGLLHFVTRIRDRRYVAVDEERGLVFAFVFFDHAAGDTRNFTTPNGRAGHGRARAALDVVHRRAVQDREGPAAADRSDARARAVRHDLRLEQLGRRHVGSRARRDALAATSRKTRVDLQPQRVLPAQPQGCHLGHSDSVAVGAARFLRRRVLVVRARDRRRADGRRRHAAPAATALGCRHHRSTLAFSSCSFSFVRFVVPSVAAEVNRMIGNLPATEAALIETKNRLVQAISRVARADQRLLAQRARRRPVADRSSKSSTANACGSASPRRIVAAAARVAAAPTGRSGRVLQPPRSAVVERVDDGAVPARAQSAPIVTVTCCTARRPRRCSRCLFSFLILIDLNRIKSGISRLRTSRVGDFYEEAAPPIARFGILLGRAIEAQAAIAVVNTVLTMIGLLLLGHPARRDAVRRSCSSAASCPCSACSSRRRRSCW